VEGYNQFQFATKPTEDHNKKVLPHS